MPSSPLPSPRDVPFTWRVTKYDPALRDERGRFTDDTWTSIADIGASYDGEQLTLEEYERVEASYLAAARAFADEAGVTELEVRSVDHGPRDLTEGELASIDRAIEILRLMLREEAICTLEALTNDFVLHVGFDYYMYIGAAQPCPHAVALATSNGLFVEPD